MRSVVPDVAAPAALLAHPLRARLVVELMGGEPLSSGTLALRVGVSPATVSTHLRRLHEQGMVAVDAPGRHRLYRLASPELAAAVEALHLLEPSGAVTSLTQQNRWQRLRVARSCYDHLAGRLAIVLLERWCALGYLT